MAALGSKDGREIVRELDALYAARGSAGSTTAATCSKETRNRRSLTTRAVLKDKKIGRN